MSKLTPIDTSLCRFELMQDEDYNLGLYLSAEKSGSHGPGPARVRMYRVTATFPKESPFTSGVHYLLAPSAHDAQSQAECFYGGGHFTGERNEGTIIVEVVPFGIRGWSKTKV